MHSPHTKISENCAKYSSKTLRNKHFLCVKSTYPGLHKIINGLVRLATLKGLAWLELIHNFYNYLKYIDFGFKIWEHILFVVFDNLRVH